MAVQDVNAIKEINLEKVQEEVIKMEKSTRLNSTWWHEYVCTPRSILSFYYVKMVQFILDYSI